MAGQDDKPVKKESKFKSFATQIKNALKFKRTHNGSLEHGDFKEDYQIAICQDGKFAVTFDTANLRIKILENTDHRPFNEKKEKEDTSGISEKIDKTVAYFEIDNYLNINKPINDEGKKNTKDGSGSSSSVTTEKKEFIWSLDISRMQQIDEKYTIFVAVSLIDDGDMKEKDNHDENRKVDKKEYTVDDNGELQHHRHIKINVPSETKQEGQENTGKTKGTVIYRLRLKKQNINDYVLKNITSYHSSSVSGICRFIENDLNEDEDLTNDIKRFIVLNFRGMYYFECNNDFELTEKFDYPESLRRELNHHKTENCTDRLLSCIYDKYLLVKQYKNNIQLLEVYDLAEMKLETSAKSEENTDMEDYKDHRNTFSINRQQFCFNQGLNTTIKVYLMENGLEVASKEFDKIEEVYSLEFINNGEKLLIIGKGPEVQEENLEEGHDDELILVDKVPEERVMVIIWDLYNLEEPIVLNHFLTIKNPGSLARTSGNLLQVDDNGKVTSVLKKVDNELTNRNTKQIQTDKLKLYEKPHITDNKHELYFDHSINPNFKPIVNDKEPWVLENYERNSYCLYQGKEKIETGTGTLQLIVGRSTVQIWHQILSDSDDKSENEDYPLPPLSPPNKGKPFLEYIWTNSIPLDQEREATRLRIEEMKYGLNDFFLKVYWYERVSDSEINKINEKKIKGNEKNEKEEMKKIIESENDEIERIENGKKDTGKIEEMEQQKKVKRKEKTIQWKYISENVKAIRHACEALKHLNKRRNFLDNNYIKINKYDKMVMYIQHIIWRFVKHRPDQFRLLDVRHNIIKNLILGDCNHLIKFILFGDEQDDNSVKDKNGNNEKKEQKLKIRHIPKSWPRKKFIKNYDLDDPDDEKINLENDMELAIYHCKGRELKDTIIISYLLEYYSINAKDDPGWMSTVSRALPLLFKYNYDDYARKFFRKECFANQNYFSAQDPCEIIPKEYQEKRNHDLKFMAFSIENLQSDKYRLSNKIWNFFKNTKHNICKFFENFDNDLGKSSLALRMVPLPGFTINSIPQNKVNYSLGKAILNILLFIFIPRWYKISPKEMNKLSPFSRMVRYENNDDIYDNPAIEAVINFHWHKAKRFFFSLFLRFLIYAFCFGLVSWEYLSHEDISDEYRNFLVVLIVIFYYLAIYLFTTEFIQLYYHGPRKYFDNKFNRFDLYSIILPVVVMSIILKNFKISDGFKSVIKVDTGLMIGISASTFFLWLEFILYLRIISRIGRYIYYAIIIFKTVFPFLLFIMIVIIAYAHTLFVLFRNPDDITTGSSTLSGIITNTTTNDTLNITLQSDFNPKDKNDNPFAFFPTAIEAAYFWINGNWNIRDQFKFWSIDLFTFIASIFLVTILQNMLIAFMNGVYEKVKTKGRQALLSYKANQIADFEALHHIHLWPPNPEPRYIHYIGQSQNFENWYKKRKDDQDEIYKDFEETSTKHTFKESTYDEFSIWKFNKKS